MALKDHDLIKRYNFPVWEDTTLGFKLFPLKANQAPQKPGIPHFPQKTSIPHAHNFYEICIFFEAEGNHEIDFEPFSILSNSIHIISPNRIHLIEVKAEGEGYILAFTPSFYEGFAHQAQAISHFRFLEPQLENPIINLKAESTQFFTNWVNNLMQDYPSQHPSRHMLYWSHLNVLLWKLHLLYNEQNTQGHTLIDSSLQLYKQFRAMVEQHFTTLQRVQDYASLLFVSPGHLNRVVKRISGETSSHFIQNRIILEAKRLLLYSPASNQEIAYKLGFTDPSYFARMFKKHTQVSPSLFRQRVRQSYQRND